MTEKTSLLGGRDAAARLAASKTSRRCDNLVQETCHNIRNLLEKYAAGVTCRRGDMPQKDLVHVTLYRFHFYHK